MNATSEIAQNMSFDKLVSESIILEDGSKIIRTDRKSGDLVTCNLSSTNWGKVFSEEWYKANLNLPFFAKHQITNIDEAYERIIKMQVRLLDNVISLNRAVVPEATVTNHKYRAIGVGIMGAVEYLTNNQIPWESKDATEVYGELAKKQLKAVIKASAELAQEKGVYEVFEGSDWQTGEFFDKRGFYGDEWAEYREMASKGMRNAYLQSPAPTSANAIINCTTPSLDPLYDVAYKEKKSGLEVWRIPSNFNNKTRWYYKSGFQMDEMWAINHIAEVQKYIDQSISHNMHVFSGITARELLRLDMGAWEKGLKTIYYTFTSTMEKPEDCINCEG